MPDTNEDHATGWRDLIDQLTPQQIAELEYCEREQIPPGQASPRNQLNCARKMAEINIARQMFADVAPPADAVGEVDDWTDWDDEVYQRMFTSWAHPGVDVSILGLQYSDGTVERFIVCGADTGNSSAAEAHQLSAALADAAAELERFE